MRIQGLILSGLIAVSATITAAPAFAHDWDDWRRHEWREQQWQEHAWREHAWRERAWREHEWRERARYGAWRYDTTPGYPGYYR